MTEPEPLRYHLRHRAFKEGTLEATERFFASDPWAGTAGEKDEKFITWLRDVSAVYEVPVPGFVVVPPDECPSGSAGGYFEGAIILPKYSALTTFWAFRYHSQLLRPLEPRKMRLIGPEDCAAWAASLFYRTRPATYLKAVEEGRVYFP